MPIIPITKPINQPLLREQLETAGLSYRFIYASGGVMELDAPEAAIAILDAHDASQQTAEQTTRAQRVADFQELIGSRADAALTQITNDLTLLGGTPTNAQVIAVLTRCLHRDRAMIKAFARLTDAL